MEQEKIIYYYPLEEYTGQSGCMSAAKRFWFQDAALSARFLSEEEPQVIGCAVPPFYYRRRSWKPQILSELMETVVCRVEGMSDTWLHPQIGAMLTEEHTRRWIPRRDTVQAVTRRLIEQYAGSMIRQRGEVTVLLGEPANTDWQMQMTRELLLPYLSRINRLLIFYEEVAETDIWMELGSHLDEYYYEYGLVPQLEPYIQNHAGAQGAPQTETARQYSEMTDVLRCGKPKCNGMILDYCTQFRYPKIMPESTAVYIDTVSAGVKEELLKRKTPQIPYVSPLKYLDTMVKSSYDKKM